MPYGAGMKQLGPYSGPSRLAKLDGRTREGRLMRDTRRALVQHVGGHPSVAQALIIDRIVNLTIRIAAMDRKFAEVGMMTDGDTAVYLAWTGTLTRSLRELGIKGAPAKQRTLAEIRGQA